MRHLVRYLDLTLTDAAANLALDEALLLEAEAGRGDELLRVWEWPAPVVVLGSGCKIATDVNESACRAAGVPIVRRSSGGGTVLWGRGCLLFSLVLSYERAVELLDIHESYRYILDRVVACLALEGVHREGISDMVLGDRKFSGNAQQRKRSHLLHHGTLLYEFDLTQVCQFLPSPLRQPEYRENRPHEMFLCNLSLTPEELKRRLRNQWEAFDDARTWPQDTMARLMSEKYGREEWHRRR